MKETLVLSLLSICFLRQLKAEQFDIDKLQRLTSFARCYFDSDCKENSFCYGNDQNAAGNCKCKDNFFLDRNRTDYECFTAAAFGEPCGRDLHCHIIMSSLAICNEQNLCTCNENSHIAPDRRCYQTTKLKDYCAVDYNCLLKNGSFAYCTDGRCECPILHHPAQDMVSCVPSVRLGDPCSIDDSCNHTYASCYGVCRCIPGYAVSRNGEKCLKAAGQFGESCEEDVQCTEYLRDSICSGNCTCSVGYHGYGVACYRNAGLGQMCNDQRECFLSPVLEKSVDCVDGVCTCLTEPSDDIYGCAIKGSGVRNSLEFVLVVAVGVLVCLNFFTYR